MKTLSGESLTYSNWEKDSVCADCECAKMKLELGGVWEKTSCAVSDWYTVYVCEYGMCLYYLHKILQTNLNRFAKGRNEETK